MALPNEVQIGRLVRFLTKWATLKGSPSLTMGTELQPQISLRSGVEDLYLQSWDRFTFLADQAAVAANVSGVRLRNPTGSNVVAVIEKCLVTDVGVAADSPVLQNSLISIDLATPITSIPLDPRGRSSSTCIGTQASPAAGLSQSLLKCGLAVNSSFDFVQTENAEIPLLPGYALQVVSAIVNQRLVVDFMWRERLLEESERA